MNRSQAMVVTAGLMVTIAGCGGSRGSASPSAGSTASPLPAASVSASLPPAGTPRPTVASQQTPSARPVESARPRVTVYVVKAGDTLSGIAMHFKVSRRALLAANPAITNSNQVMIGQKLVIPTP